MRRQSAFNITSSVPVADLQRIGRERVAGPVVGLRPANHAPSVSCSPGGRSARMIDPVTLTLVRYASRAPRKTAEDSRTARIRPESGPNPGFGTTPDGAVLPSKDQRPPELARQRNSGMDLALWHSDPRLRFGRGGSGFAHCGRHGAAVGKDVKKMGEKQRNREGAPRGGESS